MTKPIKIHRSSSGSDRHPYMKISFWADPVNHFWENDRYTESAKAYYRGVVQEMIDKQAKYRVSYFNK